VARSDWWPVQTCLSMTNVHDFVYEIVYIFVCFDLNQWRSGKETKYGDDSAGR
jgi:hypothetical protein